VALIDDPTAVTTVRRDWVADEYAARGLKRELRRLARRARRRWLRTLAYALASAALVAGAAALAPSRYASRVVFRVTPPADAALRDYVRSVVSARAHADVEVARGDEDPTRSSRLVIGCRGSDAQAVYRTATQLGRLVAAADARGHALTLIDPGHLDAPATSRAALCGWLALCAFLAALPLCGSAVAAFDARVYDLDDIRRLELPAMGAVRRFDGDNAGALVARLRNEGRDRIPRW
jgi:hypothetical protein